MADEVTKGHIKKGKEGSATPWDLLRQSEEGCEQSGRLFQVFAEAFKGKRQLSWSKGLKSLLQVDEVTDEQLAEVTEKDSVEVDILAMELWRLMEVEIIYPCQTLLTGILVLVISPFTPVLP